MLKHVIELTIFLPGHNNKPPEYYTTHLVKV